jgi:hypothetical protein
MDTVCGTDMGIFYEEKAINVLTKEGYRVKLMRPG